VIADIRFHEDAQKEFNEAATFYAMEEEGLGAAFLDSIEQIVARIAEHPESSPVLAGRVRKMRVARFPYSVRHSVVQDEVRILAVGHDRRRPFFWRDRR
jgi:toxin ParE1/3/4